MISNRFNKRCYVVVMIFAIVFSSACAVLKSKVAPSYQVQIDEPLRIRFSGKGAGAGMMLSSSMGPMGIAIGVAIDEGIAKKIDEQFIAKGHSLDGLVNSAAAEAIARIGDSQINQNHKGQEVVIHLHKIGVKMVNSDTVKDAVAPDIQGEIIVNTIATELLQEADSASKNAAPMTLDQLTVDGDVTYVLLKDALTKSLYNSLRQAGNT